MTDGLVGHWDGIDNTLAEDGTRSHQETLSVWSDLSGKGNDVRVPGYVTVESNALVSVANTNKKPDTNTTASVTYPTFSALNGLDASANGVDAFTVEVVMQRVKWRYTTDYDNLQAVFSTPRGSVGYRKNSDKMFYLQYPHTTTQRKLMHINGPAGSVKEVHTLSIDFGTSSEMTSIRLDAGVAAPLNEDGNYTSGWSSFFAFFSNPRADIRVHAIRVYDRVLTDAEREQNFRLDRVRFQGDTIVDPEAYREVEYIESTGTQIIDTGYLPNPKTRMEASIMFTGS